MAYQETIWKDRIIERPRTFYIQENSDDTITLIPEPGEIIEAGTPVNAEKLNNIENGIKNHEKSTEPHKELKHLYMTDDQGNTFVFGLSGGRMYVEEVSIE